VFHGMLQGQRKWAVMGSVLVVRGGGSRCASSRKRARRAELHGGRPCRKARRRHPMEHTTMSQSLQRSPDAHIAIEVVKVDWQAAKACWRGRVKPTDIRRPCGNANLEKRHDKREKVGAQWLGRSGNQVSPPAADGARVRQVLRVAVMVL